MATAFSRSCGSALAVALRMHAMERSGAGSSLGSMREQDINSTELFAVRETEREHATEDVSERKQEGSEDKNSEMQ